MWILFIYSFNQEIYIATLKETYSVQLRPDILFYYVLYSINSIILYSTLSYDHRSFRCFNSRHTDGVKFA